MVKNPPANAGDMGSIPVLGRFPWRRKWHPTLVFSPGKFHRQRSLVGCNLWSCKESDTMERLSTHWQIFSENHQIRELIIICILSEHSLCAGQGSRHFHLKQPPLVALVIILLLEMRRDSSTGRLSVLQRERSRDPMPVWPPSPLWVGVGVLQTIMSPCRAGKLFVPGCTSG